MVATGDQAIPYGTSLGVLHTFTDTTNGPLPKARTTKGSGIVVLPTRRRIELKLLPTVSTPATTGDGSLLYRFLVDGAEVSSVESNFNRFWETKAYEFEVTLEAGRHTFAFTREHRTGLDPVGRYGLNNGNLFPGTVFKVTDLGVA